MKQSWVVCLALVAWAACALPTQANPADTASPPSSAATLPPGNLPALHAASITPPAAMDAMEGDTLESQPVHADIAATQPQVRPSALPAPGGTMHTLPFVSRSRARGG